MIVLRARDNGQLLAAVTGPASVRCTPEPQRALSFASEDEARAFLREHHLAAYFEARPLVRTAPPSRATRKPQRAG